MATKADNLKEIALLEKELDVDVITTGLNAEEIAALVVELREKALAKDQATENDSEPEAVAGSGAGSEDEVYVVPKGKALVCRRGVLPEGKEIDDSDISGGQKNFDILIEKKCIVTKEEYNA